VVVAEPEPAEYVKICDVYGAGYFYIPGTETCLRIGGYVRWDASAGQEGSFNGRRVVDHEDGSINDTWHKQGRFSLKTWTAQETELGTLKSYTQNNLSYTNGIDSSTLKFAWIQLGGLRVGKDESAFDTFIGYAGNVINDTLVPYGDFDTNVVQYYFDAGSGFSAMVSLEEGSGAAGTIDSYIPHVVGGVKYMQGWGAVTGVLAYDSNYEEVAGKIRLDLAPAQNLALFVMVGYGTNDKLSDPAYAVPAGGRGFYKQWGGNWAIWSGGTYTINEKTRFNLQASYDEDKNLGVAANVEYDIVPGLTITAEVDYINEGNSNWTGIPAGEDNAIGGILRFQRSF
ncbi:porin, partial [Mesorhizobium sp. M4A.F.Ca.ET.090.04.2.1]